jgi:HSP20 family protein
MAIVRWDPFRELSALQSEVNRLFSRAGGEVPADRQSWMPSADIIETGSAVRIMADLAGMDPKDIHLEVEDNVLTLSGERRFEEEVQEGKFYRIERRYGSFQRSVALPQGVDADKIQAHYENGVLEVVIPKVEQVKPKKIPVAVKGVEAAATVEATATEKTAN